MAKDIAEGKKWGHAWTANWYDFIARAGGGESERGAAELEQAGNNFARTFEQMVGRQPTMDEASRFFADVLKNDDVGYVSRPNELRPLIQAYVADEYAGVAQKERETQTAEKAKASTGTVSELFKSTLNREPTKAEADYFSKRLASGDFDEYTLTEGLKQLPEYVEKQDLSARDKLRGELSSADTRFYQDSVLPSIQSRFAQQGRTVDGSSFAAATANAAKELNTEREKYLATLGYQDYASRRQNTLDTYASNLARNYQLTDQNTARGYQIQDQNSARANELLNYNMQKRAYDEYLRRYGSTKKKSSIGAFAGGLIGGGAGAYFGGPQGAAAGYSAGSGLGSFFDA